MHLLSGARAAAPTAAPTDTGPNGAITKVRDTIETIEKREMHIGRKIENEVKNAKAFSAQGKKREALQCIKRKKMYEKQLEQIRSPAHPLAAALCCCS